MTEQPVSWVANERRAGLAVPLDEPFLLEGAYAKVLPVPDEWVLADIARMAAWFAHFDPGTGPVPLPEIQQVLWADPTGRFPDDPGCAAWVVRQQPILKAAPLHFPARPPGRRERHPRRRSPNRR